MKWAQYCWQKSRDGLETTWHDKTTKFLCQTSRNKLSLVAKRDPKSFRTIDSIYTTIFYCFSFNSPECRNLQQSQNEPRRDFCPWNTPQGSRAFFLSTWFSCDEKKKNKNRSNPFFMIRTPFSLNGNKKNRARMPLESSTRTSPWICATASTTSP